MCFIIVSGEHLFLRGQSYCNIRCNALYLRSKPLSMLSWVIIPQSIENALERKEMALNAMLSVCVSQTYSISAVYPTSLEYETWDKRHIEQHAKYKVQYG